MLKHNQHVIAEQIVQLDVPSTPDTYNILQAVAQRLRTHTMVDIEALFDRYARPEQTIRLERVEINLGNLDGIDWQEQFETRLVSQLTEVLKKAKAEDAEKSSSDESRQDDFEQWLYFLDHGRLPSWAESPADNWLHQWVQKLDSRQWQSLRAELASNIHVRQRLIHTLDNTSLVTVVEKHFGLREVFKVFNLCFPVEISPAQQLLWRSQFWLALLDPVTSNNELESGIEIMQRLLQLQASFAMPTVSTDDKSAILPELPETWSDWLAMIQNNLQGSSNISSRDNSEHSPASVITTKQSTPEGSPETPAKPAISLVPNLAADTPRAAANGISKLGEHHESTTPSVTPLQISSDASDSQQNNRPIDFDEVIDINGAGCIILHPFLEELFRENNLLQAHDFRDEASRQRAVHLLSHLTFADEATPEYKLLLPKLLCGMAWEEPLAPIELTDEERQACDELLDAVLRHWQVLKGCSANWLREQFFLRPARLEQVDEGWRLTVERRAQDVLLDRLPWGLGVISLPWRQGLIYVRWME